jgi:hypothetical protein
MRRRLVALAFLASLAAMPPSGAAEPPDAEEPPVPVVTLDVLPLSISTADLPPAARARAEAVLTRSLFAQRVTGIRFPSREPVYRFLLDHPDFAASVARALRLGQYRLTPIEDGYWGDDGRGATGHVQVLYADDHRRLYYLAGRYQHRLLPAIEGQILLLLEFRHEDDGAGGTVVEQSLTGHVRIDTPLVGAIAQALGALTRPLVERTVEGKVRRFFRTVARVSRWAYDEPEQLAAALDGHPDVGPAPTVAAFRAILLADRPPAWARASFRLTDDALRLSGP